MAIEHENENGEIVTVYTAEELAAEREKAEQAIAEVERLKKINAEKTENFRKYNQMTEEEKAAYDANTTELMKRYDSTAEELENLKTVLSDKEKKEQEYLREKTLEVFHGGDKETSENVKRNYDLLAGMPESTPEDIRARAEAAAKLAGVTVQYANPLYSGIHGEAPRVKAPENNPKMQEAESILSEALGLNNK